MHDSKNLLCEGIATKQKIHTHNEMAVKDRSSVNKNPLVQSLFAKEPCSDIPVTQDIS